MDNIEKNTVINGNSLEVLKSLPDNSIDCCVTSPPYYALRDYGCDGQIGLEETPEKYIESLCDVFSEVRRVLTPQGTLWLNIGDSYNGNKVGNTEVVKNKKVSESNDFHKKLWGGAKPKDLIGIPWMLAFALRSQGWYLRQDIIWCLSGGAYLWVKSQKGVMPMMIKDLVRLNPKTVQLWNGEKWVNVIGYGESNDNGDKLELVLRSGERIGCTAGHKWVLQDNHEVLAKDLKVGDVLKTCNLPDSNAHTPSFLTKDILWFLGLYLAQGSHSNDTIQIALNANKKDWIGRINSVAISLGGTCTYTIDGNKLNVRVYSQVLFATLHQYIGGKTAKDKHLNNLCWSMPNEWLKELIIGYFDGDGHYDNDNNRIRIGFTRNYYLERDFRVLAARLGAELTIKPSFSRIGEKVFPSFRGEWRWCKSSHFNSKDRAEIMEIRKSRARHFYDISVDSDDHLFSLASGVLTHNCKPNPMPESVTDRCTKSHEYIFLLSKSQKYYFDYESIMEPCADQSRTNYACGNRTNGINKDRNDNDFGERSKNWKPRTKNCQYDGQKPNSFHLSRENSEPDKEYYVRNKRDVWTVNTKPCKEAHFATYPFELIKPCILAGCPEDGIVLDPFMGSGTTAIVARSLNRNYLGVELNPEYIKIAHKRLEKHLGMFQ